MWAGGGGRLPRKGKGRGAPHKAPRLLGPSRARAEADPFRAGCGGLAARGPGKSIASRPPQPSRATARPGSGGGSPASPAAEGGGRRSPPERGRRWGGVPGRLHRGERNASAAHSQARGRRNSSSSSAQTARALGRGLRGRRGFPGGREGHQQPPARETLGTRSLSCQGASRPVRWRQHGLPRTSSPPARLSGRSGKAPRPTEGGRGGGSGKGFPREQGRRGAMPAWGARPKLARVAPVMHLSGSGGKPQEWLSLVASACHGA